METTRLANMPTSIDSLKSKRKTFKSRLTNLGNWLKGEEVKEANVESLELKLTDIVSKFSEWESDHAQLVLLDPDHEADHEREDDTISDTYFKTAGDLKHIINQRTRPSPNPSTTDRMF